MYKHILIPTDGSAISEMAIDHGVALAKATNAVVTVLTVFEPPSAVTAPRLVPDDLEHRADMVHVATQRFAVAEQAAAAAGVPCDFVQAEDNQPYRAIINTANERGCDLIVMGSHGRRGVAGLVLGSETVKVLTHSTIPVVVVRAQHPAEFFAAS